MRHPAWWLLAALLAGLYPTRRISRISLREGLRSL